MQTFQEYMLGINFGISLTCLVFSILIAFAVQRKNLKDSAGNEFKRFLYMSTLAIFFDCIAYIFAGKMGMHFICALANIGAYTFTDLTAAVFSIYTYEITHQNESESRSVFVKKWPILYALLAAVVAAPSPWTGWFYYIGENGVYYVNDRTILMSVFLIPLFLFAAANLVIKWKKIKTREAVLISVYIFIYIATGIVDSFYIFTTHYIALTVVCALMYQYIILKQEQEMQKIEKELVISELNALRLQMNPHYIYNTLASIDGLCVIDPDQARKLIRKFTKHLRSSYIDNTQLTTRLSKEIESLDNFLEIEKIRFPGIEVVFNVNTEDFEIPTHIMQPIVENAIKHGICARDDMKGIITVDVSENDESYMISISDNGVGFDTENTVFDDNRNHIGIENVKKRLELISKGRFYITSIQGVGTKVVMEIPKGE